METAANEQLIKSKERVQKHGEVFTPPWMVEQMLGYPPLAEKALDIHATVLEPSAGEGAFLVALLEARLKSLAHNRSRYGRGANWPYDALWAVATLYGIEYLEDNLAVARARLRETFAKHYQEKHGQPLDASSDLARSLDFLLRVNFVQGDTLTRQNRQGEWLVLSEWRQSPRPRRAVLRLPFYFATLFEDEVAAPSLFEDEWAGRPPLPCYQKCQITEIWWERKMNVR